MYPGNLTARPGARGGAQSGAMSGLPGGAAPRVLTTADVLAELLDVAAQVRTGRRDPTVSDPAVSASLLAPAGPVTLARLLERHGTDFVVGAYTDLLGRLPEPDSLEYYRLALLDGRLSKVAILGMIRSSPEGRRRGEPVPGLRRRFLLQRAYRVPVLGRALRTAVAVLALPRLLWDLQRLEQQNALTQERLARLERALASPGPAGGGPRH